MRNQRVPNGEGRALAGVRLQTATLVSRTGDQVTVEVPNADGGVDQIVLDPPYSSPGFLPAVGAPVVLEVNGSQVRVSAQFQTTVTNPNATYRGEFRTADSGERFVINPGGVSPGEIQFYPLTGSAFGNMKIGTGAGSVGGLEIKGPVPAGAALTPQLSLNEAEGSLSMRDSLGAPKGQVSAGATSAYMSAPGSNGGSVTVGDSAIVGTSVFHNNLVETYVGARDTQVSLTPTDYVMYVGGGIYRMRADATGLGFNDKTPIARPAVGAAAAATVASVQTLVNNLRTALINLGLVQN